MLRVNNIMPQFKTLETEWSISVTHKCGIKSKFNVVYKFQLLTNGIAESGYLHCSDKLFLKIQNVAHQTDTF